MDAVLIILGVIGVGAIVIAAYVFTVAARHYVSDDEYGVRNHSHPPFGKVLINRNPGDRRSGQPVTFPFITSDVLIRHDRRRLPDRRLNVASPPSGTTAGRDPIAETQTVSAKRRSSC